MLGPNPKSLVFWNWCKWTRVSPIMGSEFDDLQIDSSVVAVWLSDEGFERLVAKDKTLPDCG